MTTPAVNLATWSTNVYPYQWSYTGGAAWETKNITGPYDGWETRFRPVSINNPVRVDGTRAPSGFSHRWSLFSGCVNQVKLESLDGIFVLNGSIPVFIMTDTNVFPVSLWLGLAANFPLGVDQRARTKFMLKLGKGESDFGETLAELREVAGMATSLGSRIIGAVASISAAVKMRRTDVVSLIRRVDRLPRAEAIRRARLMAGKAGNQVISDWLGYQWGIKPLCEDIRLSSKELSRLVIRDRATLGYRETIRGGASEIEELFTPWNSPSAYMKSRVRHMVETGQHYSITVGYPIPDAMRWEQLGLQNPLATGWNIIRLSQLVDYAVGVGDWLTSLTPVLNGYQNQQFIEGSVSRVQRIVMDGYELEPVAGWKLTKGQTSGRAAWQGGRFERTVLSTWPTPALLPQPKKRIGLTQMANTLSVLSQLIQR